MKKKVLVVTAHPDDEILGAGGTLIRHRDQGDEIAWLIVTEIFEEEFSKEKIKERQKEIEQVASSVNMKIFKLGYATMKLSSSSLISLIPQIGNIFSKFKPEIIYVLNHSDAHSDHRFIYQAVMACTKSFRYPFIREVLMYECLSETEFAPALSSNMFLPTAFVDISSQMDEKIKLMNIYKSELGEHPFPRSERNIKALGTFRGAIAGVDYAEAFQVLKSIRIEKL